MAYPGPLRAEPIAIELHNTLYAARGSRHDGLAGQTEAEAWLEALGDRLPAEGDGAWPRLEALLALRDPIRRALQSAARKEPQDAADIAAINRASAGAPCSPAAAVRSGALIRAVDYHRASRAQIVLAAFAGDAIDLLTGSRELRQCGAPGCVLLFVSDHPRRAWCSAACGNRARQARHYHRSRGD